MFRKAVLAGAIMVGLLGSASTAWGDPPPDGSRALTSSEISDVSVAVNPTVDDYLIYFCGHGFIGYVEVQNGAVVGGWVSFTSIPSCQGGYHTL